MSSVVETPFDSAQGDMPFDSAQGDMPFDSAQGDMPFDGACGEPFGRPAEPLGVTFPSTEPVPSAVEGLGINSVET